MGNNNYTSNTGTQYSSNNLDITISANSSNNNNGKRKKKILIIYSIVAALVLGVVSFFVLRSIREDKGTWVLLKSTTWMDGELSDRTENVYGEFGITETISYSHDSYLGTTEIKTTFEYNAEGLTQKSVDYDIDGSIQSSDQYIYDEQGDLICIETCSPDGSILSSDQYIRDEQGDLIRIETCSPDGEITNSIEYYDDRKEYYDYDQNGKKKLNNISIFDDYGNVLNKKYYDDDGDGETPTLEYQYEYTYNNDVLTQRTIYSYYEGELSYTSKDIYDEDGVLISSEIVDESGSTATYTYEYLIDDYENMLKITAYCDGKLAYYSDQEFGFYKDGNIEQYSRQNDSVSTMPGNSISNSRSVSFPTTVLLDKDGIKITALDYVVNDFGEFIKISFENNTDMSVLAAAEFTCINGICMECDENISAEAHKKIEKNILINTDYFNYAGIDKIKTFSVIFDIFDTESYNSIFEGETSILNVEDSSNRESHLSDGFLLYDKSGIQVFVYDAVMEDGSISHSDSSKLFIDISINNPSDDTIFLSGFDTAKIDGADADNQFITYAEPHMNLYTTYTVTLEEIERFSAPVEEVDLTLEINYETVQVTLYFKDGLDETHRSIDADKCVSTTANSVENEYQSYEDSYSEGETITYYTKDGNAALISPIENDGEYYYVIPVRDYVMPFYMPLTIDLYGNGSSSMTYFDFGYTVEDCVGVIADFTIMTPEGVNLDKYDWISVLFLSDGSLLPGEYFNYAPDETGSGGGIFAEPLSVTGITVFPVQELEFSDNFNIAMDSNVIFLFRDSNAVINFLKLIGA